MSYAPIELELLGQAISKHRKELALTQKALSELSGLTINYISLLEGGYKQPSLKTLDTIAACLQVPTALLVVLGTRKYERYFCVRENQ